VIVPTKTVPTRLEAPKLTEVDLIRIRVFAYWGRKHHNWQRCSSDLQI